MKTRVTYIISDINKAISFEWVSELLNKQKIELNFILLNPSDSDLEKYLRENGFPVKRITYKNKFDLLKAFFLIAVFILKRKPDVIHTHLFAANLSGLTAAWLCRVRKRIYTRHHSSYHHDYFPKAVKYDRMCNCLATHIIAITDIVKSILMEREHVPAKKIVLIHHGFKLHLFTSVPEPEIAAIKRKYATGGFYPVVGAISRYTEWKGLQYVIPAFQKLLQSYPNAKLVLANAKGDYSQEIKKLLKNLPAENYIEIEFENNLFALYKLFDAFVHTPVDKYSEAFGQVYVEALAAGVPSVFTISGIANDFIKHKHNAMVVDYKNSDNIYRELKEIISNKKLAETVIQNGKTDVESLFPVSKMISELEAVYLGPYNEK